MLKHYIVTCGAISQSVVATGAADAIARAMELFGNAAPISARRAA